MKVTYLSQPSLPAILSAKELFDLGPGVRARMLYWKDPGAEARHKGEGHWIFNTPGRYHRTELRHSGNYGMFGPSIINKPLEEMGFELI